MRKHAVGATLAVLCAVTISLAACGKNGGTAPIAVETTAEVFMLRFNSNPNASGVPDYRYCVESYIDDGRLAIASASLTGMSRTSAYAYNSATGKWWDDAASRYCTQAQPVFPMNYSIFIQYKDNHTVTLPRAVTSWSVAP